MNTTRSAWAAACLMLGLSAGAWATVEIQFIAPEEYRDADPGGFKVVGGEYSPTLAELQKHFEMLGRRYLAADETLRISVLDVDLAGEILPIGRHLEELRVLRPITWPSLRVKYALERAGTIHSQGAETIKDMNYLMRINHYSDRDALRYEKLMLDEWFAEKFGAHSH